MADDNESKKDELRVMGLISEGQNRVDELVESLDWTRERVEDTLDDLKEHEYVKTVQEGGDTVVRITDRGRDQLPKLLEDVADDTRKFVENVSETFQKHMGKVFPKVNVDVEVDVEEPDTGDEDDK